MIESIEIKFSPCDKYRKYYNPLDYAKKIPLFAKPITFKPGLNLVVGANGSGKSTLLNYLSQFLFCHDIGYSCVANAGFDKIHDLCIDFQKVLDDINIQHDGQCCFYYAPENSHGCHNNYFMEDEYFEIGRKILIMKKETSKGQFNMYRLKTYFLPLLTKNDVEYKEFRNSSFDDYIKQIETYLSPKINKGQKTIIMDEPDCSLSIDHIQELFTIIKSLISKDYQIIMSLHSFALYCMLHSLKPYIIETSDQYCQKLQDEYNILLQYPLN